MSVELAALLRRDLRRLCQQMQAFASNEALLWQTLPGVENSAGNLVLHLEGNLREYVGRQLGGIAYVRERPREFSDRNVELSVLLPRLEELAATIPPVVAGLTAEAWSRPYPEKVLGPELTTGQFVTHLFGHLNYHLGQIDYLRRILSGGAAINYVKLD